MTNIRSATLQDLPGVYRVCLQTGDSGSDATGQYANPDLLGHIYVGPYLVGQPRHAFVASDREGVAGYTFAADDTRAFEEWEREHWWPSLREQYPKDSGGRDIGEKDEALIQELHAPGVAPEGLLAEYPAHLHIDLLPRIQGHGIGRLLMEQVLESLHQSDVTGVHLAVGATNDNAIAFYRHLGFSILQDGDDAIYMGKKLP